MIIRNYVIGRYHVIADNHLLSKICHLSICQTVKGDVFRIMIIRKSLDSAPKGQKLIA